MCIRSKIIRLKGLHSNQKGFWDILKKTDFIIGDSYYDFQAFISQLHLIGSPPNSVWRTTLSQLIFDLLWSKSEIPTISKIKAREGANFGFSRFQPCLFSQIWRGSRIWTIKKDIEICQRRATKIFFMKFWQRAAEIWDLKEGQNRDFSSPISQQPFLKTSWKFYWWLSSDISQCPFLWLISGNLTKFEKKDMVKTFKFKKWPLLWPLSQKWLRFQTWTIKAHWKIGLLLISLSSLVDFQLNGAEIFRAEIHSKKPLV